MKRTSKEQALWEILVPTIRRNGKPIRTRFHRVWDDKVRAITGGLTVMPVGKGQWVREIDNAYFNERMIPVRIMASKAEMMKIVDLTLKYYDQDAVLWYCVSDQCYISYQD